MEYDRLLGELHKMKNEQDREGEIIQAEVKTFNCLNADI